MTSNSSRQRGLSLIEVVVAMAVVAILAVKGVPTVQTAIANSRLTSAAEALTAAASSARNEAIKRNTTVRLSGNAGTLTVVASPGTANEEVLSTITLAPPANVQAFNLDYASSGLTLPFGTERTISVAQGMLGCGEDLRCPAVRLAAGGAVKTCPMGACQ